MEFILFWTSDKATFLAYVGWHKKSRRVTSRHALLLCVTLHHTLWTDGAFEGLVLHFSKFKNPQSYLGLNIFFSDFIEAL